MQELQLFKNLMVNKGENAFTEALAAWVAVKHAASNAGK